MGLISSLSPRAILKQLRQAEESSTFERLGTSRHVADLRLIFSIALLTVIISSALAILFEFIKLFFLDQTGLSFLQAMMQAVMKAAPFIGAVGAVGGGVLTWAYQSGSRRLGVVDLFACEIMTLCRVGVVVGAVRHLIDTFESNPISREQRTQGPRANGELDRFTSKENYFPVFEGNAKDLELLEADVVSNVTAFYTYMKAVRDYMRRLAELPPPLAKGLIDPWHETMIGIIYMLFLAHESARQSIRDLVEFEPTHAENTITILQTELPAYQFLRGKIHDEGRGNRLALRQKDYLEEIPALYGKVKINYEKIKARREQVEAGRQKGTANQQENPWEKAWTSAAELKKIYECIFSQSIEQHNATVQPVEADSFSKRIVNKVRSWLGNGAPVKQRLAH